ncbi:hypothetical protein HFO79_26895 [Rhizobium leguminosarum]|nr:hypothetical protein [Rhizobium leguminosarum]
MRSLVLLQYLIPISARNAERFDNDIVGEEQRLKFVDAAPLKTWILTSGIGHLLHRSGASS